MRSVSHSVKVVGWSFVLLLALPLAARSEAARVTDLEFEVLPDAEVLRVHSEGELEVEVRELDEDTLSIGLRGAVLDDRATHRIVPQGDRVVRVVTATPADDDRGSLVRIRIEHAPGHRPAIEPTASGLSAAFSKAEARTLSKGTVPQFRTIPLTNLIREVAAKNGETLLLTARIPQRVALVGPRPLYPGELSALLDTALLMKSRVAVPMPGGGRKIMNASGAPLPWVPELPEDPDDSPLVTLVRLEHVDSAALLGVLQPLMGRLTLGVAHPPTNSILLAGSAARVARLQRAMRALDKEPEEEVLTITLRERGADEILQLLEAFFEDDEIIAAQSELRTNTLLMRVRSSVADRVRGVIERLDQRFESSGALHVFRVHHADPIRLADQLRSLQGNSSGRRSAGSASLARRSFSVVVHEPTSSLILQSDVSTARIVRDLLAELDVRPPRVRVDVLLVEVFTGRARSVGFNALLPFGTVTGSGATGGLVASTPSFSDGVSGLVAGGGDFVGRLTRDPLVVPIVNALGEVVDVTVPQEIFQIDAKESGAVARVLQNPSLLVASGDEQEIFAGNNVPVPVSNTEGGNSLSISSTIERYDTGTKLRVTPTVGLEGQVQLELYVESSRLVPSAAGDVNQVGPTFAERVVETTVQVPAGALAVIGFAARPFSQVKEVGVPFLRSIPILGALFRSRSLEERNTTLLVAVRVQVESAEQQALSRALKRELASFTVPGEGESEPAVPAVSGRVSPAGPTGGRLPGPRS